MVFKARTPVLAEKSSPRVCVLRQEGERDAETGTGVEVLGKEQKVRPCFIKRNMVKNIFAKLKVSSHHQGSKLH